MSFAVVMDDNFTNAPAVGTRSVTYPTSAGGVANGWVDGATLWSLPVSGQAKAANTGSFQAGWLLRPVGEAARDQSITVYTNPSSNTFTFCVVLRATSTTGGTGASDQAYQCEYAMGGTSAGRITITKMLSGAWQTVGSLPLTAQGQSSNGATTQLPQVAPLGNTNGIVLYFSAVNTGLNDPVTGNAQVKLYASVADQRYPGKPVASVTFIDNDATLGTATGQAGLCQSQTTTFTRAVTMSSTDSKPAILQAYCPGIAPVSPLTAAATNQTLNRKAKIRVYLEPMVATAGNAITVTPYDTTLPFTGNPVSAGGTFSPASFSFNTTTGVGGGFVDFFYTFANGTTAGTMVGIGFTSSDTNSQPQAPQLLKAAKTINVGFLGDSITANSYGIPPLVGGWPTSWSSNDSACVYLDRLASVTTTYSVPLWGAVTAIGGTTTTNWLPTAAAGTLNTTVGSNVSAGTNVVISCASTSGASTTGTASYCVIGTGATQEIARIKSFVTNTSITVASLKYAHNATETIVGANKLQGAVGFLNENGAQYVSVMLGTNDAKAGTTTVANYQSNLQAICNYLLANVTGLTAVVIQTIFPQRWDQYLNNQFIDAYNRTHAAIANGTTIIAAQGSTFDYAYGPQGVYEYNSLTGTSGSPDQFHPGQDSTNATSRITIGGTTGAGPTVTVTINGTAITYTYVAGDTSNTIAAQHIAAAINASAPITAAVFVAQNTNQINIAANAAGSNGQYTISASTTGGATATINVLQPTPSGSEDLAIHWAGGLYKAVYPNTGGGFTWGFPGAAAS